MHAKWPHECGLNCCFTFSCCIRCIGVDCGEVCDVPVVARDSDATQNVSNKRVSSVFGHDEICDDGVLAGIVVVKSTDGIGAEVLFEGVVELPHVVGSKVELDVFST